MRDFVSAASGVLLGGTVLLIISGTLGWAGGHLLHYAENSASDPLSFLAAMLLGFAFTICGIPGSLGNVLFGELFGISYTIMAMDIGEKGELVRGYIGGLLPLIPISLVLWFASRPEVPGFLVPIIATLFPSKEARENGRPPTAMDRWREKKAAEETATAAKRAERTAELDEILADLERTEHELKRRKR